MKRLYYLLLFLCPIWTFSQVQDAFPVRTTVENGVLEGDYHTYTGIQTYFGVPFAKPPVGQLRWKAPQPLASWEGIKEVKNFGPRPVQALVFGDMKSRSAGLDEDCLYLNVWTPAKHDTKGLPVLVYFYGGGNVAGDASEYRYDGESMAKEGIVVVTVNYRLNIFGFLAHPDLSAESPYKASGNYGLLDQQAALQWVQKNITAFGGDPSKVTIAGESAGSIAVSVHMASPLSKNLITGAIGESGAAISTMPPVSLEEAEKIGADFLKASGYNSISEFRKLSTQKIYELYNASKRFGFPMVVDGHLLPGPLPKIFEARQQAQVPLLLGWNSAEMPGMAFMQGQPFTKQHFIDKVKETYPDDAVEILKLYSHGSPAEVEKSATDLASDRFISYGTWKWFDLHRKNSDKPVYRYLYSKIRPPLANKELTPGLAGGTTKKDPNAPTLPEPIGAPHAAEIEYAMGNLPLVTDYVWTEDDYKVSRTMQLYFANFIKSGDPNGADLPQWPAAKPNDGQPPVMVLDTESFLKKAENDARYLFMDRLSSN
jgi:para-nitrobenzyl esterase